MAAIHFILGIIIVTIAQSFTALMVGRVFIGLGVGFGLAVSKRVVTIHVMFSLVMCRFQSIDRLLMYAYRLIPSK